MYNVISQGSMTGKTGSRVSSLTSEYSLSPPLHFIDIMTSGLKSNLKLQTKMLTFVNIPSPPD